MVDLRRETDSLGVVEVPADRLWGAQTQRSLEHSGIGRDLMPRERPSRRLSVATRRQKLPIMRWTRI
jgi:fumarate hydratase class II